MYGRVKAFVAIVLLMVIFAVPLFLIGETSRNPSAKLTELPWKGFLFVMVGGSIGGPILGFTIVRLLYWIDPGMAEILKDREDPSQTKEFLDWAVTMGIDSPRPEDLAKMKVTSVAGRWMEKMPEEVHLTMEGRDGAPVHYTRTDLAERIERRCYSSAARYGSAGAK